MYPIIYENVFIYLTVASSWCSHLSLYDAR